MTGQYSSNTNGAGETAPNEHEGWGILDMHTAMQASFVDGDSVETGDSWGWSFQVPSGAPDFRVTAAWTDPASTPSASTNLVNDLDLNVKDPSEHGTMIPIISTICVERCSPALNQEHGKYMLWDQMFQQDHRNLQSA